MKCTFRVNPTLDFIKFNTHNYLNVVKWLKKRGWKAVTVNFDGDIIDMFIYIDEDCTQYVEVNRNDCYIVNSYEAGAMAVFSQEEFDELFVEVCS